MKNGFKKGLALGFLALAATGAVTASMGDKITPMHNADVQAAIEADDYNAFVDAVSEIDADAADRVTEEMFDSMVERFEAKEDVDAAIESEDYDAWVEAVSELPHGDKMVDVVSEDEFSVLVEMHEAKENGDQETVRELAEEIGLDELKNPKQADKAMEKQNNGMPGPAKHGFFGKIFGFFKGRR